MTAAPAGDVYPIASRSTPRDTWTKLSAPLDPASIQWRQDGKPTVRDGKYFARFVAYVEANTVRERLDSVVPGEWDLTLERLPDTTNSDGEVQLAFKARLQVLGVIREDVGMGGDYKSASTDAFKRAGVRFGIAHELYAYGLNFVQVESESRFAKPVEDPAAAYARRSGTPVQLPRATAPAQASARPSEAPGNAQTETCPKCEGPMWDNRATKRNPKAPDFKCRDRDCDGAIWPPKEGKSNTPPRKAKPAPDVNERPPALDDEDDELPF
jgi:hypothetical protein